MVNSRATHEPNSGACISHEDSHPWLPRKTESDGRVYLRVTKPSPAKCNQQSDEAFEFPQAPKATGVPKSKIPRTCQSQCTLHINSEATRSGKYGHAINLPSSAKLFSASPQSQRISEATGYWTFPSQENSQSQWALGVPKSREFLNPPFQGVPKAHGFR